MRELLRQVFNIVGKKLVRVLASPIQVPGSDFLAPAPDSSFQLMLTLGGSSDDSHGWVLATHLRDLEGILCSWLWHLGSEQVNGSSVSGRGSLSLFCVSISVTLMLFFSLRLK